MDVQAEPPNAFAFLQLIHIRKNRTQSADFSKSMTVVELLPKSFLSLHATPPTGSGNFNLSRPDLFLDKNKIRCQSS